MLGDVLCHNIIVIDDNALESNESFRITLSSNEPALTESRANVTIIDDSDDCK